MKKRIVIKIGTTVLTKPSGVINEATIERIVDDVAELLNSGAEVIIVTSGAIGAGLGRLKLQGGSIREKQALASIGQGHLMSIYEKFFRKHNRLVAQVLLTSDDLAQRQRYLNARNTLLTLLSLGAVPVVNENDTVAVEEIKFGDNDRLSALVASKVEADQLVILTDVDGFFSQDPRVERKVKLIKEIEAITPDLEEKASGRGTQRGTGGMVTKLEAARIATASGITMYIANGNKEKVIREIWKGENPGTKFLPGKEKIVSRKRWIAFDTRIEGKIAVDEGAREALLKRGKSLLPSGISGVEGRFNTGACVAVVDTEGKEFARGLTSYSSDEIEKIKGKKTSQIETTLGYKDYDEVIHRDNLVILKE
ncbi:glutamate 5-kinase [bacterium]|nr:glutamate 5-kinase [bacterium]NIN92318.1 glutamate 5-kinase [bacterium]NIO18440.1 glutamate 5-kinase [bacterium]NIO73433.1 glutamate 5-kinase [bacterium]